MVACSVNVKLTYCHVIMKERNDLLLHHQQTARR